MLHLKYRNINDDTITSLNELLALDLPIREGIKVAKVSKKINNYIEIKRDFDKKILEKYSEKDENGKIKPVKDEAGNVVPNQIYITNPESYSNEVKELGDVDIEIKEDKISIDTLGLDKIKPKLLLKLDWLIDLGDTEEEETEPSTETSES